MLFSTLVVETGLKGQPPYSSKMIRLALLLRHTSLQAYKLLLEEFCVPSLSLLAKLKSGNLDAIKAAELLRQKKYHQTTSCLSPIKCI